jgi:hypothetical protein
MTVLASLVGLLGWAQARADPEKTFPRKTLLLCLPKYNAKKHYSDEKELVTIQVLHNGS